MSLVDVSELLTGPDAADFMESVTLRRPSIHLANEGEAIASYDPDAAFDASVQPMKAEKVAELPEGQRGSGKVYVIYTATELRFSPGKTDISDVLSSSKGTLVVVGEEDWAGNGYHKYLAVEYIA